MSLQNSRWRWPILVVVAALTILAVVIGSLKPSSDVPLQTLSNVNELQAQFNRDEGKARVILLLSPT